MGRTTITLDVETRRRLQRIAAERGMSMAAVIREAIDATIDQHAPKPRSLGVGASGTADTGRRAGGGIIRPASKAPPALPTSPPVAGRSAVDALIDERRSGR
jgi:predicted transcriptional regulator